MLIQRGQRPEPRMTEITLETRAIPSCVSCDVRRFATRVTSGQESVGIGDDIVSVELADVGVDDTTVYA